MTRSPHGLAEFEARWRARLAQAATMTFATGDLPAKAGTPAANADAFAAARGFNQIGYNWEMLDPAAAPGTARSAIEAIAGAIENHMALPQQSWLGAVAARECAAEFVTAFDPACVTILTNRMDFGWHPLSDAAIEWAFIGYDDDRIALLLLTSQG